MFIKYDNHIKHFAMLCGGGFVTHLLSWAEIVLGKVHLYYSLSKSLNYKSLFCGYFSLRWHLLGLLQCYSQAIKPFFKLYILVHAIKHKCIHHKNNQIPWTKGIFCALMDARLSDLLHNIVNMLSVANLFIRPKIVHNLKNVLFIKP